MKRILSVFLAVLLLCGMTLPAYAAAEGAGTTVRLSETSGTATVRDASGKEVSVKTDMRLYNGYSVETGLKSSAYLSLDGTKAVKLDSSTHVEVKKNGKQLEVALVTGNVFFSVEEPLATDESFNIRTSTMVTGIRGSFGWVNPREAGMVHGHGTITCTNPVTGESRTTEITSGEGVRYEADGSAGSTGAGVNDQELKDIDFDKTVLTVSDMPAIAREEIAVDPEKQELVGKDVPTLDVVEIVESADEKRAQENAKEEAAQQNVETELAAQEQEIAAQDAADEAAGIKDEVAFEETSTETTSDSGGGGGGGSSGGSSGGGASAPASADALNTALAGGNTSVPVSGNLSYAGVTVPAGKTLTLTAGSTGASNTVRMTNLNNEGTIVVSSGVTLILDGTEDVVQAGTITNSGNVTNEAEMALLGSVDNSGGVYNNTGTLAIAPGKSFTGGTVNNSGTIIVDHDATFTATIADGSTGKLIRN